MEGIPKQYCENPDIVMKAVLRDPTQIQYASEVLRADRDIVAAAISKEQAKDDVPPVIKWASGELRGDKDFMIRAIKANPEAYAYLSSELWDDPDILTLEHNSVWAIKDDLKEAIRRIIEQL